MNIVIIPADPQSKGTSPIMAAKKRETTLIVAAIALLGVWAFSGEDEGEDEEGALVLVLFEEAEPLSSSLEISATGGSAGVTKSLVSKCTGGGGLYSATSCGSRTDVMTSPGFMSGILYDSRFPVHKFPVATGKKLFFYQNN